MNYQFNAATEINKFREFLSQAGQFDIFQSPEWLEVSRVIGRSRSSSFRSDGDTLPRDLNNYIFSVTEGEKIYVGATAYEKPTRFGRHLYIQHGPIVTGNTNCSAHSWGEINSLDEKVKSALDYFLAELERFAVANNSFLIMIEPLATEGSIITKTLYNRGYREQPGTTLPKYPMFIDLLKPEQELLALMDKNTRYYINYAKKKGITIRSYYPNSTNIQEGKAVANKFYDLLSELNRLKQFKSGVPPLSFFTQAWDSYKGTNNIGFMVAEYDGEVVSANFSLFFGNWAGSYFTANSRKYSKLRAGYLLKWATILEAKNQGRKVFDMWGYRPGLESTHPEYGYGKFKQSFNPVVKTFAGKLTFPVNKLKYGPWVLLRRLKHRP